MGEDPSPRAGEAGPEEEELTEAASLKASSSAALYMTCGQPWAPRPHQRRTAAVWEAPVSEEARLLSRTQPPQSQAEKTDDFLTISKPNLTYLSL